MYKLFIWISNILKILKSFIQYNVIFIDPRTWLNIKKMLYNNRELSILKKTVTSPFRDWEEVWKSKLDMTSLIC